MSENLDRREFLRNATIGAATIAGAGILAGCSTGNANAAASSAEEVTEEVSVSTTEESVASDATEEKAVPTNRVCEILGIEKPVIAAPMWALTNAEFVAAVSNAGGLGMLNIPSLSMTQTYGEPDEIYERAVEELTKLKELTDKPFGIMMPGSDVVGFKDLIFEYMPTLLMPGFSSIDDVYDYRDAGIKILGAAYDSSVEAMQQMAQECDLIYLKCYGCGGSIPPSRANALALLEKFYDQGIDVPIVPGGGIANATGARAVTMAGAEGVWVGTRFLATEESPMHPDAKQLLLEMKAAEMVEIDFNGSYNHANPSPKALELIERIRAGEDPSSLNAGDVYLFGMRLGDLDNWYLSVSDSVDSITEITTCKDVVDELGDAVLATQALLA